MKSTIIALCTAAFFISCNNETKTETSSNPDSTASASTKESDAKSDEWIPVDSATAMKSMMEAGTPGKEQAMLAKSDGNWKADVTMWESPEAAPMKSTGVLTNKMILDGRYQQTTFKGDMMGMPFQGTSTTGYDNARKVWVSSWVDNMSTGIMNMEGTWDDATKTLTYTGKMLCPANGKMCEMKQVMKIIDDKTEVMEMYGPDMKTGKQYKNMEMKMTKS
ncbi:MAG: DUF1579 domain-containing protein, partial [Chitinophagaceae bacterium]